MGDESARVELITERRANRTSHIGLGLLASLAVGFGPLTDAIYGHGSFESAMGRFVACVAVCVVASTAVGHLLDGAHMKRRGQTGDSRTGAEATEGPVHQA